MKTKLLSIKNFIKYDSRGFTLAEVIIAMGILLIAAIGALNLFTHGFRASAAAKHVTAATNIARAMLEEIKSTPFEDITTAYPDDSQYTIENTSLPDGAKWTVTYPDGTEADPLTVLLVVSWQGRNGNITQVKLITLVTKLQKS